MSKHNLSPLLMLIPLWNVNHARGNILFLPSLFQRQVSQQQQHSEPEPPVCSQRPDQHHGACKLLLLPHPDHLPHIFNAAEQQAAQTLPGAQELQRQLQHSGQLLLKNKVKDKVELPVIKVPLVSDRSLPQIV